jgi:hypothetical protein
MTAHFRTTYQGSLSGLSTSERDDNYHAIIHCDGNWRIIVCKAHIQWIIQRGKKAGTERRWRGDSYVTCKTALMRLWADKTGACAKPIAYMPDSFRGDAE